MTGVLKVDDIQDAGANSIVSSNGSGTLTFGNFTAATITASTALVPDASDGAALGTSALEWSDLFLADGAVINFGDDQDVTLTHVADTGLLLNSTMQLQFNDASQYINAPSATVLDINATDEIELNATLVDINANVEISGTATTTGVHTFSATPVFPDGSLALADLDIDGGTDIGEAIVDADLFIIDNGAGGTNRKTTASRLKTYAGFTATTITGTTALAAEPATTDEIIISDAGTLKRLDLKHIYNTPSFFAYMNGAQTVATGSWAKLEMDAEVSDTDSAYDHSTNYRFTPGVSGRYFIWAKFRLDTGDTMAAGAVGIYKNGSIILKDTKGMTDASTVSTGTIINLDADDYVECYAYQNSGGDVTVNGGSSENQNDGQWGGWRIIGG